VQLALTRRRNAEATWVLAGNAQATQEADLREGDLCSLRLDISSAELADLQRDGDEMRLMLSGERLDHRRYEESKGTLRVTWEWKIKFYAGEITLDVLVGDRMLWSGVLDVRPHAGKLGREAYAELLADLQVRAEGVIFGATAAQWSVAEADVRTPSIARLAMLHAHVRELERSFAAVAVSPNRRLVAERENMPLDRARRIDARAFCGIIRSPSALAALGFVKTIEGGPLERARVDHPRREHTYNTPPNRHIAALIRRMEFYCRDLQEAFAALAEASERDPETQARAISFGSEAATLRHRLLPLSRADFLDDVEAAHGDTAAMIAAAKDPAYSRFDRVARQVLQPRVSPGRSLCEKLWLRRTYELYEYWCFFSVAEALAKTWGDIRWRLDVAPENGRLFVELPAGCHIDGQAGNLRIRFTFQQTFQAYKPSYDIGPDPYSISGQRRPDMVLSVNDGDQTAMIILDAKYRCGRDSIHEALGNMHIYRDSLKLSGRGAKILGAYILTPAHDADAGAYFTEDYHEKHHIGGFDLAPGGGHQADILCRHLRALATVP
jgi:hypothetical protein